MAITLREFFADDSVIHCEGNDYSEPVYKDHPRDQQNMVLIQRWSLYAASIAWKGFIWGPVKYGL